jgi:general stress protein 26
MDAQQVIDIAREMIRNQKEPSVLASVTPGGKPDARYMAQIVFEEPFTLFMESYLESHKVEEIRANPNVVVLLADPDYSRALTIEGTAEIEANPDQKRRIYEANQASDEWFDGPDDPNFAVLRIRAKKLKLLEDREIHTAEL